MTEDSEAWIQSFAEGKNWFDTLHSEQTKRNWIKRLRTFCLAVNKTPKELIELKLEGIRNTGTAKEWQAEQLMVNYLNNNLQSDNVRCSVKSAIKGFYHANWRDLNPNAGEDITQPEPKQRSPKMNDLVELCENMTFKRDKFLVWFLASCPFRVGTVSKLKWKDLVETGDKELPYQLVVEATRLKGSGKGKYSRLKQVCFLHYYATEYLEEYKAELKQRHEERRKRLLKDHFEKRIINDKYVKRKVIGRDIGEFKINPEMPLFVQYRTDDVSKTTLINFDVIFDNASLSAWGNLDTKKFSPHDIRDFTQSALENKIVNPNFIAPFLGHKVRGTDYHYSNHDIDELRVKFKESLPYLIPETIKEVKSELDETKSKLQEATDAIAKINDYLAKATKETQDETERIKQIRTNL